MLSFGVAVMAVSYAAAQAPAAPSVDRPCSFASAGEVSSALGVTISAANDEHFRCKYTSGSGWVETKLLDYSLKISKDIYEYNKAHGKPVAGIGDQAYLLGATLAAKVGDVIVVVDASNLPKADTAKLKPLAMTIVRRIP